VSEGSRAGPGDVWEGALGVVASGALPYEFSVITGRPLPVGDYVVAPSADGRDVLGMVDRTEIRSIIMEKSTNSVGALAAGRLASANPRDKSYVSHVRVMGLLEELRSNRVMMPSLPPMPGSPVRRASESDLSAAFGGPGEEWVPVGALLRSPSVRVHVNLNRAAQRHLAILASTGAGKSNLLALIAKHVASMRGTMVIFDYHGEYLDLDLGGRGRAVRPRVNPRLLDPDELADLLEIREAADKQRHVLSEALERAKDSKDFWEGLRAGLRAIAEGDSREYREPARRVLDILASALRRLGPVLDPESPGPLKLIAEGYVNVVNLSDLSPRQADVVISQFMDEVLIDRKRSRAGQGGGGASPGPIVLALEEAHAFIPGGDGDWRTRDSAARIAREGRKFGVSLVIVSQRPQRLDQDVLSQVGSLAIGRLLNQRDRSFVQESSEFVTEEISDYLPDLNPGEMVLVGQWVKLPALVRVDRVPEKLSGRDVDFVREWRSRAGPSEDTDELIRRDRGPAVGGPRSLKADAGASPGRAGARHQAR